MRSKASALVMLHGLSKVSDVMVNFDRLSLYEDWVSIYPTYDFEADESVTAGFVQVALQVFRTTHEQKRRRRKLLHEHTSAINHIFLTRSLVKQFSSLIEHIIPNRILSRQLHLFQLLVKQ